MLNIGLVFAIIVVCQSATVDIGENGARIYYPGVCEVAECRYGSCEIYNSTTFKCHCLKGVTGVRCDELDRTGNPCASYPCWGDAICLNVQDQFTCICPPGRTGPTCEAHVGPCRCQNQGICVQSATGGFTCTCPVNFGGYLCEYNLQDFSSCKNKPCQNFGFCTSQGTCICPLTHTGKFCEILVPTAGSTTFTTPASTTTTTTIADFCKTAVCLNKGICVSLGSQGFCNCPTGFFGQYCEYYIATTTPGVTTASSSTTTTTTMTTMTSITTATNVNPCPSNTASVCKNNAQCFIINGATLYCLCAAGFTGPLCETSISTVSVSTTTTTTTTPTTLSTTTTTATTTTPISTISSCPSQICQNGGTCGITATGLTCSCKPNFEGVLCETQKPFCRDPSICKNGGLCLPYDNIDGVCYCIGNFTGLYCESVGCDPNPCLNDHQCFLSPTTGKAKCFCRQGYSGDYCEDGPLL